MVEGTVPVNLLRPKDKKERPEKPVNQEAGMKPATRLLQRLRWYRWVQLAMEGLREVKLL